MIFAHDVNDRLAVLVVNYSAKQWAVTSVGRAWLYDE